MSREDLLCFLYKTNKEKVSKVDRFYEKKGLIYINIKNKINPWQPQSLYLLP